MATRAQMPTDSRPATTSTNGAGSPNRRHRAVTAREPAAATIRSALTPSSSTDRCPVSPQMASMP